MTPRGYPAQGRRRTSSSPLTCDDAPESTISTVTHGGGGRSWRRPPRGIRGRPHLTGLGVRPRGMPWGRHGRRGRRAGAGCRARRAPPTPPRPRSAARESPCAPRWFAAMRSSSATPRSKTNTVASVQPRHGGSQLTASSPRTSHVDGELLADLAHDALGGRLRRVDHPAGQVPLGLVGQLAQQHPALGVAQHPLGDGPLGRQRGVEQRDEAVAAVGFGVRAQPGQHHRVAAVARPHQGAARDALLAQARPAARRAPRPGRRRPPWPRCVARQGFRTSR